MTKVFNTDTVKGLRAAERFQQRAYSLYESVTVRPVGFSRVQIDCVRPIQTRNLGQSPDVVPDRQA